MKTIKFYILLLVSIIFTFISCEKDIQNNEASNVITEIELLPHSMKGYELYSWPNESEWHFTLITGTNRIKNYIEITETGNIIEDTWINVTAISVDEVKIILNKLPNNEELFWLGEEWIQIAWQENNTELQLPQQKIIIEIKDFCNENNIILSVFD